MTSSTAKRITVTLTEPQYMALRACVALHEAEDDDYPGDKARQGEARARDNAWQKMQAAWKQGSTR